ncbi:unnamed protein product, partial [Ixodes persulcatus]
MSKTVSITVRVSKTDSFNGADCMKTMSMMTAMPKMAFVSKMVAESKVAAVTMSVSVSEAMAMTMAVDMSKADRLHGVAAHSMTAEMTAVAKMAAVAMTMSVADEASGEDCGCEADEDAECLKGD